MQKLTRILKDKSGMSVTVQMLIGFLLIALVFSMFIGIASVLHQVSVMDRFADEMAIVVSSQGKCTGTKVSERYDQLVSSTGLSPKVTYDTSYYDSIKKTVQYGDSITVNLEMNVKLIGWGDFYLPMTLKTKATRQSMQYWK